jgi:hypothetical protein
MATHETMDAETQAKVTKLEAVLPFLHAALSALGNGLTTAGPRGRVADVLQVTTSPACDPYISIDGTIMVMWDDVKSEYNVDLIISLPGNRHTPPEEDYKTLHTETYPEKTAKLAILAWANVMVENAVSDASEAIFYANRPEPEEG